jgi:hypothetical protein
MAECHFREVYRIGKSASLFSDLINLGKLNQNSFVQGFSKSLRIEVLNANLFNSVDDWLQD